MASRDRGVALVVALTLPVVAMAAFTMRRSHRDLTASALSRRQTIAQLAAITIRERFERLSDVGVSLATRVQFRKHVREGRWQEAIAIMRDVPGQFPFIHRIILADLSGVQRADMPAIPGAVGLDVSKRDWFSGARRTGRPYLSEVYIRAVKPRHKVLALSAPVKGDNGKPVGILMLQVRADTLFQWSAGLEVGPAGFVYFVDRKGHVIGHPRFSAPAEIADFSSVPTVSKALRGRRGVELADDAAAHDDALVVAYEPVTPYGWAVVAQQPQRFAFALRDRQLRFLGAVWALILLFEGALVAALLRTLARRRRAEAALRESQGELAAVNKELEAFSYSIAHDLRAPLRAIDGFSRLLSECCAANLDQEGQRLLGVIRDNARRMGTLIDDLLAFARLGRKELHRSEVDMAELVRATLDELPKSGAAPVDFRVRTLPRVQGDPALLREVVSNLLANAVKYSSKKPAPVVEVGGRLEGGRAVFWVKDNGAGFDMRYAHKLFAVFSRLHGPGEFEGSGVGLAIVERIVRKHGGAVRAEGRVGEGATFEFSIPMGGAS